MISLTRSNRRRFTPSVDSLESRQLLSTVRPAVTPWVSNQTPTPSAAWVADPGPIVVTQGQVATFVVNVKNSGSYRLNFKAEQSVFDKNQQLTKLLVVIVDTTIDSHVGFPSVYNEMLSPKSTSNYTEMTGMTFDLKAGHSYKLYLNESFIGGSDILIKDLKIIPEPTNPTASEIESHQFGVFGNGLLPFSPDMYDRDGYVIHSNAKYDTWKVVFSNNDGSPDMVIPSWRSWTGHMTGPSGPDIPHGFDGQNVTVTISLVKFTWFTETIPLSQYQHFNG